MRCDASAGADRSDIVTPLSTLIKDPARAARHRRVERFFANDACRTIPADLAIWAAGARVVRDARAQRLAIAAGLPLPPTSDPPVFRIVVEVAAAFQRAMDQRNGGPIESLPLHLVALRSLARNPLEGTVRIPIAASDYKSRCRNQKHAFRASQFRVDYLKAHPDCVRGTM